MPSTQQGVVGLEKEHGQPPALVGWAFEDLVGSQRPGRVISIMHLNHLNFKITERSYKNR